MKQIKRFDILLRGIKNQEKVLYMPKFLEFLQVGNPIEDCISIWVLTKTDPEYAEWTIRIVNDEEDFPSDNTRTDYIGSTFAGGKAWHLFY